MTRRRQGLRLARPAWGCRLGVGVILAGPLLALGGCAGLQAPQPWEKGVLARPAMTFNADRGDQAFTEHIYTSKEALSGGSGVGGGGCGCN